LHCYGSLVYFSTFLPPLLLRAPRAVPLLTHPTIMTLPCQLPLNPPFRPTPTRLVPCRQAPFPSPNLLPPVPPAPSCGSSLNGDLHPPFPSPHYPHRPTAFTKIPFFPFPPSLREFLFYHGEDVLRCSATYAVV